MNTTETAATNSTTVYVVCSSGDATGVLCTNDAEVTVEFMPEHLRASHRAAGNKGYYPHNGAIRIRCCADCAEALLSENDDDFEWAAIVAAN